MSNEIDNLATRYLLGELTDEEATAFEERYFIDPESFSGVLAAESRLIDEYKRGRLSLKARELFELHYLADPRRRERADFGGALVQYVDSTRSKAELSACSRFTASLTSYGTALRLAVAAAVVIVVAALGLYVLIPTPDSQPETAQVAPLERPSPRIEEVSETPEPTPAEAPKNTTGTPGNAANPTPRPTPPPQAAAPRLVTLALVAGGVRGGTSSTPTLVVPKGTAEARLSITSVENAYPSYRLALRTMNGDEISGRTVKPPTSQVRLNLSLTVPADRLASGEYVLVLTGVQNGEAGDEISRSLFRVRRPN